MYNACRQHNYVPAIVLVILLSLIGGQAYPQYYYSGQEPASIQWRQIKTEHVKFIYPDYYEQRARKLASYLDSTWAYAGRTLDYFPKRIPLVMHTQSARSTAFVGWAPKRMEFNNTPPQDMYAQPWLEQLAQHEFRHVVQVEKLNQGPTKVISWLFGQQGTAAILGLYVPFWFLEGDAVATETGLSHSGRGRQALFEMKLRAQMLSRGMYTYDKATMGSYRDFIPNHYELGYLLVAEGRRKYGIGLWEHTLTNVARRPYMITPFQKGIRDVTGKRKIPFYRECLENLSDRWAVQDDFTRSGTVVHLSPETKGYTDYRFPACTEDGNLVALKSSLDDIYRFVVMDDEGNERRLFTPGFIKPEAVSYANGKMCWAESRPDLRWSNRSYTVFRLLDIESGKAASIKHGLRLFAPALDAEAKRIAAVHLDSLDRAGIYVMDAESGNITRKIIFPEDIFPLTPAWAGQEYVLTVLVSEDGKTIARVDVSSGEYELLLPWDYADIAQLSYSDPYIFFTASWSGIQNIYALNTMDNAVFKVSNSRFGAQDPCISPDGTEIYYADYSAEGYRLVRQALDKQKWVPKDKIRDQSIALYRTIAEQEEVVPPWSEMPPNDTTSEKYSKLANLFNFHSWAPLAINASTYDIQPGASIMSQNLLSSSFLTAGYAYNLNEQAGKIYGTYSYAGWYPILDITADYGLRRDYAFVPEKTEVKWHETNLRAGLRLPLTLNRGKHYAGVSISAYANQVLRRMVKGSTLEFRNPDIFSMWYSAYGYRQIKSNYRDIFPRWGQNLGLYYRHAPLESGAGSYIAAGILGLYFPGIIRHQGLNIYTGYQQREIGDYKFSDLVAYPRGISGKQDEELLSIRSTYAFPIAYPDWSIGPVIYMKRIRANLFYDYAFGWNGGVQRTYTSFGADLLAEVHVLRFLAPMEFGVRGAYLPDEQSIYWSFLFSIGFDSFYLGDGR
ncbi:MAG: hypothetical protein V2I47_07310 [Bacteroidales bacterium]|jgi:Tol biopolymer transport system component|nr:hypothetical protein [Bacteroidales bacterium]